MKAAIKVRNVAGTNRYRVAVRVYRVNVRGFIRASAWRFKDHYIKLAPLQWPPRFNVHNLGDGFVKSFFSLQGAVTYLANNPQLD